MLSLAEAKIDSARIASLREAAENARRTHYAPYSEFLVLAAVEADGAVFGGSNIEVANYSLTKHAEETAILAAIAGGMTPRDGWLKVLYVVGAPCGSCRQFIYEFGGPDVIILVDDIDQVTLKSTSLSALGADLPAPRAWRLGDLLPEAFGPSDLGV
jgi:cytidine deaminase